MNVEEVIDELLEIGNLTGLRLNPESKRVELIFKDGLKIEITKDNSDGIRVTLPRSYSYYYSDNGESKNEIVLTKKELSEFENFKHFVKHVRKLIDLMIACS